MAALLYIHTEIQLIASMGVACLGVDTNTESVSARGIDSHSIESWGEGVLPHGALGKHSSRFDVVMWDSSRSREVSQSDLSLWQVRQVGISLIATRGCRSSFPRTYVYTHIY